MSQSLVDVSAQARAAQAAYALLTTPAAAPAALGQAGTGDFTPLEASRFLGTSISSLGFELRHHQPNDLSGFSATVFFDRSSNRHVLSIRGTEGPADLVEDLRRIGLQGFAGDQLVSLYRY